MSPAQLGRLSMTEPRRSEEHGGASSSHGTAPSTDTHHNSPADADEFSCGSKFAGPATSMPPTVHPRELPN